MQLLLNSKSMRDWIECKICRNIQNVVAKLESNGGTNHALLVNCHFDSVPQSPGEREQCMVSCVPLQQCGGAFTKSCEGVDAVGGFSFFVNIPFHFMTWIISESNLSN